MTRLNIRMDGRSKQQGVVLVIALIFLLLLTLMALAVSGRALLQERMAGAMRSALQAQWSAETALRGAEWQLFNGSPLACYDSSQQVSSTVLSFRQATGWFTTGATVYQPRDFTKSSAGNDLAYNPVYMIEYLGSDLMPGQATGRAKEMHSSAMGQTEVYIYRITARATGGNPNIVRVLESTFASNHSPSCGLN